MQNTRNCQILEVMNSLFQQVKQTSAYSQSHNKMHWSLKLVDESYDDGGAWWLAKENYHAFVTCPLAFGGCKKIKPFSYRDPNSNSLLIYFDKIS